VSSILLFWNKLYNFIKLQPLSVHLLMFLQLLMPPEWFVNRLVKKVVIVMNLR